MADPCGKSARGDGGVVSAQSFDEPDHGGDLQQVQGHDGQSRPLSQNAPGVSAARIPASEFADICLIENFSYDQREGDRSN